MSTGTNGHYTGVPSLRWLLRWASQQYLAETPSLEHTLSATDAGGAPELRGSIRGFLHLGVNATNADDWRRISCRTDEDGHYRTPLRAALSRIRDPEMRLFLRDLIPEQLSPGNIATVHGIPRWAQSTVMHAGLLALWRGYHAAPMPQRSWVDLSVSQQNAEAVA